jgi:hypothetical protein
LVAEVVGDMAYRWMEKVLLPDSVKELVQVHVRP